MKLYMIFAYNFIFLCINTYPKLIVYVNKYIGGLLTTAKMDAYDFTINLIENNTILDYETYTEQAIKAILANDLTQNKFIDMLKDFKSFEGNNHKFCINFNAAWLKYALDGVHDKDKMSSKYIIKYVLGNNFTKKESIEGTLDAQLSTKIYEKINWKKYLGGNIIEDRSPQRKYMIIKCKKLQTSNNSWRDIDILICRPKDLLDIMTTSKCVSEYRKYFITLAEIRRSYQETYLSWVIEQYKHAKLTLEQKVDNLVLTNDKLIAMNQELLTYSKDIKGQNTTLIEKVDNLTEEVRSGHQIIKKYFDIAFAFMTTTTAAYMGSAVMQQQLSILQREHHDAIDALKHMKVFFACPIYKSCETIIPTDENELPLNI